MMETFKSIVLLTLFGVIFFIVNNFLAWYWALLITLILVGYFAPNTKASKKTSKKSDSLKVSDFITEDTYTKEEAAKVVELFSRKFYTKIQSDLQSSGEHFLDEIDRIVAEYKFEVKSNRNDDEVKLVRWYERELKKIRENVKPQLKQYLSEMKKEGADNPFHVVLDFQQFSWSLHD